MKPSNAVKNNRWKKIPMRYQKNGSSAYPTNLNWVEYLERVWEIKKSELVWRDPVSKQAKQESATTSHIPQQCPEGRRCGPRDFLLHRTEHPEKVGSPVYVRARLQAQKFARRLADSQSLTDNMSFDYSFLSQLVSQMKGHLGFKILKNTQDTFVNGTETPKKVWQHQWHGRK